MRARAQRDRLQRTHVTAPVGGINTVAPGVDMPATDCVLSYNLIGAEYGLRSRLGWREHVTGLGGQVRSILSFAGSTAGANRMFACTSAGIWDVSSSTAAPTQVVAFPVSGPDAGYGTSTVFVNAAGAHFLVYTDEENGLYVYSEASAAWTQGGISGVPVTGVDPTRLAFVLPWKNRLWFVERGTAKAWYLDVGAVSGAATGFNFGARFKAGGDLRCLASWTYDGGSGIDDRLVAVSGGGDVVIYTGIDPSSASTFSLSGVWFLGAVPAGRRLTTDSGGDVLVMSTQGIVPLSKLVIGNPVVDRTQYATGKITNLFNQLMASTQSLRGWAMRVHPQEAALMVLVPVAEGQPSEPLVMSLATRGWHQYRDMPIGVCAEPWNGTLYFGTEDGRVCVNDGYVDGVTLADPSSYTAIQWSLLTGFANLGDPRHKRVQQITTYLLSQGGAIAHQAEARYNWDVSEVAAFAAAAGPDGSAWDSGNWDEATWGGAYQAQRTVFGAYGFGSQVAVAIRGAASSRMTLTGFDVAFDVGGSL